MAVDIEIICRWLNTCRNRAAGYVFPINEFFEVENPQKNRHVRGVACIFILIVFSDL